MFSKFIKILGGDPNKKEVERLSGLVGQINSFEPKLETISDDALRAKTDEFRARLARELNGIEDTKERNEIEQSVLNDLLPEAFAVVREASKRTIGLRHYDVQMLGGSALHQSKIAEMRTGEGKTLVATLPVYLNALTGRGVHLITVNDYLARRDARWMGPVYKALGLEVGVLQMAAATENGKKAFIFDPEKEAPQEDKDRMRLVDRKLAYACDIVYGTNSEFGFDYLRDNMTMRMDERVQRGHYYAIVDEVDNVLIDEARTPLIISGPAQGDLEYYGQMAQIVNKLNPEDYDVSEKDRNVTLTEVGTAHVEQLLGQPLRDPDRPEDVTSEQARLLGYLEQALRAQFLFKRNKDYLILSGKVVIVDEFTGRQMPGRRWSDGLHQAVEAKENVKVEPENVTYATITIQNYFRMYQKLAGMTGTALTEAEEFHKIYKLDVLPIPTNLEYTATRDGDKSALVEVKTKDNENYAIAYFAKRGDVAKTPVFWRRTDYPDVVYRTVEAKLRSIVTEIVRDHVRGRPILVGTTSVDSSELLSGRLRAELVRRLMQIQLLRQAWFSQNDKEEDGRLYAELEPLYKPLDQLEPGFLRQFAKPLNISINPEEPANISRLLNYLRLNPADEARLRGVIQGGVPHEVLNARRHTEESQIIAGAGAFGAVTIATNMAGRGVDIKLGGEIADEITAAVSRVLRKAGYSAPYDMRLEDRRQALLKLSPEDYGLYDAEVRFFLQHFADMELVRELGGLHVIGSERHEARRIDNQLRGRAARQGDPGSSRFYLSLQDDLMRMFGGEQVDNIMQRFRLDDDFPLENRIVSNLIEGSQHRVEGANFDVRKHLLEYDDVLNAQRLRIYSQRDRVFTKEDLSSDVLDMLRSEIAGRVGPAMTDPEGPWKLLAWLEQTQPPFVFEPGEIYPSFNYRLLLDNLTEFTGSAKEAFIDIARRAVQLEESHHLKAIETTVQRTAESLETQVEERFDILDTFLEGLKDSEEQRRPQELLEELQNELHMQFKLNGEQLRTLASNPATLEETLKDQIDATLTSIAVIRLGSTIESRIQEPLPISRDELSRLDWETASVRLMESAEKMLQNRQEKLTGPNGQLARELDILLTRVNPEQMSESDIIQVLSALSRGRRTAFDAKTHRQVSQEYTRFSYAYLTAQLMTRRKAEHVQADVLEHLETARQTLETAWGNVEFARLGQNATTLADFGPSAEAIGLDPALPPASLTPEQRSALRSEIGRRRLTEFHRQVLLGAITEQWVDYLTRVEALRVSIGLEAYGQRDPLVQYKTKASEMFQALVGDIRTMVVGRIFQYLPRISASAETETESAPALESAAQSSASRNIEDSKAGRKRHKKH